MIKLNIIKIIWLLIITVNFSNRIRSNWYTNFIGDYNIDENKILNSHITNDLVEYAAKDYFEIKHLQTIHIKNDKNFSDVVIWHLQK